MKHLALSTRFGPDTKAQVPKQVSSLSLGLFCQVVLSLSILNLISVSDCLYLSISLPICCFSYVWLSRPAASPTGDSFLSLGTAGEGEAGARGRLLKLQTGFLVAGSRLGLNMGESQLVVGIHVYGPSRLGRRSGGFGPTTSWRRETCPDSFGRPHTWVQARSPTTSAFLEVRQPAQSRRPKGGSPPPSHSVAYLHSKHCNLLQAVPDPSLPPPSCSPSSP